MQTVNIPLLLTTQALYTPGFHTGICSGGGNFVSGEQWACEACLPRWGLGVLPQNFFEKVSALILVGFGNQALVIAPAAVPVNCL